MGADEDQRRAVGASFDKAAARATITRAKYSRVWLYDSKVD